MVAVFGIVVDGVLNVRVSSTRQIEAGVKRDRGGSKAGSNMIKAGLNRCMTYI